MRNLAKYIRIKSSMWTEWYTVHYVSYCSVIVKSCNSSIGHCLAVLVYFVFFVQKFISIGDTFKHSIPCYILHLHPSCQWLLLALPSVKHISISSHLISFGWGYWIFTFAHKHPFLITYLSSIIRPHYFEYMFQSPPAGIDYVDVFF